MGRILAIIVLAAVLILAVSVPALAKPSEPPDNYGQYNSWLVQSTNDYVYPNGWDPVYGKDYLAPIMWAIWGGHGWTPWNNGGEYVKYMKDIASP